jgi:hypothetical protein
MDGGFQHNEVIAAKIHAWMDHVTSTSGIDRFDDIHIDRLNSAWKSKEYWIGAGLEAFVTAIKIRNERQMSESVALIFSLNIRLVPHSPHPTTEREFFADLNHSPPSLYLFHAGKSPRDLDCPGSELFVIEYPEGIPGVSLPEHAKEMYFYEFKAMNGETYYCRNVCIEA